MASAPFRIGMFGAHLTILRGSLPQGTVGGGVYELIKKHAASSVVIKKICVRSLDKPRDFAIDAAECQLVTDPDAILQDPEIDCVVEVMGGTGLARTVVLGALAQRKAVVTANKALLAAHLEEIVQAATGGGGDTASTTPVAMEAAVCGGIPIIQALQSAYAGDTVRSVSGIMNGTTNYMLCKMEDGANYDAVLKEAQDLGFAEADPTADVEGHDVRAKIALLAKLAFGQTVNEPEIPCKGISKLQLTDIEFAHSIQSTIKLIGKASCSEDGRLSVSVTPTMVANTHMFATIRGAGNAVAVDSANMGLTTYAGPGAGRFPTANSVVADILRVAAGRAGPLCPKQTTQLVLDNDFESDFYIRIPAAAAHAVQRVAELADQQGICLRSLSRTGGTDASSSLVVMAEACRLSYVEALCRDLVASGVGQEEPVFMPVLA